MRMLKKFGSLLMALAFKFGLKLISVTVKMAKMLKVGKVALAGGSFIIYASVFTWKFALLLMFSIAFHELGHIWAMRRCGMRTKGIYFLPFLGAAAVADDEFPSREVESFVAMAGPVWGLSLALATAGAHVLNHSPVWAAAAGWMAMVNLFNLLPINPLDGGRVLKSVAFSIHQDVGKIFYMAGVAACAVLAYKLKMGLFLILLGVGVLEMSTGKRSMERRLAACDQECREADGKMVAAWMRPSDRVGIECASAERAAKMSIQDRLHRMHSGMARRALAASILLYISISAALWAVLDATKHVPGSLAAMKFLQGS